MDLSWIATPAGVIEIISITTLVVIVVLILAKRGVTIGKDGVQIGNVAKKLDDMIAAIQESDSGQTKKIDALGKQIVSLSLKLEYNTRDLLRFTIHSETTPLDERLWAAWRYLQSGGNGATQKFINEKLVSKNHDLWSTIQKIARNNAMMDNDGEMLHE